MHLPVLLNIISKHLSVVLRHLKGTVGSQYSALLGNQMLRFPNRVSLWSLIRHLQLLAWVPWETSGMLCNLSTLLCQGLVGLLLLCLLVLLVQNLGPPWILAYLLWPRVILFLQSLLGHSLPSRPTQSSIRRGRAHRSDLGPAQH
ncbi:hypothetical protein ISCGN_000257 [Ixodes scapularis]